MKQQGSSLMVLVVVVLVVVVMKNEVVSGAVLSPSQCMEERRLGVNACKAVVFGQAPSAACCERVRVSHFECVCPVVTPKLTSLISVNSVINLLKRCGRRVPRHFKCGSLNFP
ncbi:hypothetical protein Q3G72_009651 [Acer saccharum]|nr:hypothetical protein Q3G72_009651 [Acer saccharum]